MTNPGEDKQAISISIGSVSGSGHIVVSGGDSVLSVDSRGVAQESDIRIAGVKTSRQKAVALHKKLDSLAKALDEANLPQEAHGKGQGHLEQLRAWLSGTETPDIRKLFTTIRFFVKASPKIAKEAMAVVRDSLFEEILASIGVELTSFLSAILRK